MVTPKEINFPLTRSYKTNEDIESIILYYVNSPRFVFKGECLWQSRSQLIRDSLRIFDLVMKRFGSSKETWRERLDALINELDS